MDLVTALAVVIGIMGGIATWLVLGPLAGIGLMIWAIFIGWASFFHCGGKEAGLKNSAIAHVWGAICAAVALLITPTLAGGMGVPLAAGLCVGVTVVIMILGAKVPALGAIPASVYGYAATAAANLLSARVGTDNLLVTAANVGDAGAVIKTTVLVAVSMVIGCVLGYISEKVAGSIVKA